MPISSSIQPAASPSMSNPAPSIIPVTIKPMASKSAPLATMEIRITQVAPITTPEASSTLITDPPESITMIRESVSTSTPTKPSTSSSKPTVESITMIQELSATMTLVASPIEILPTPLLTTIATKKSTEAKASHSTKMRPLSTKMRPQSTKMSLQSTKIRPQSTKIKPHSTNILPQSTPTSIITTTKTPSTKPPTIYTKYSKATGIF